MKDDRSPKHYIADDSAKNDLASTEMISLSLRFKYPLVQKNKKIHCWFWMAVAWHFSKWPLIPMTPTPPNLTFKVAFVERIQNMSFGPHVKPWPWQTFYHMDHFWLREVWGEEFRTISSASTMPLVQVTKAPFAPIIFCIFRSSFE